MNTITMRSAALVAAATLALAACTSDEKATFDESTAQAQSSSQGQPTAAAGEGGKGDVTQQSAAAAGVNLTDLGKPIATATVPAVVEGDPEATMEVSLYSLSRDGKTVTGIFSFTVDSDSAAAKPEWLYDYLGGFSWEPYLVDTTNLARHDVLGDFKGRAGTDSQGAEFLPGQTFYGYASFAAPPQDITTMTVSLVDGAPAATKVPLQ